MKKTIVINLGNKGVILSLKRGDIILEQVFLDGLDQESIGDVNEFFYKNRRLDAYIMLDTVAQNYNYKIFPHLNYFDLIRIANRRFQNEIPKNDLKYKKFLYRNSSDKKSVYLFVSASTDSPLREWLTYFETIKNNLLGIFMVPFETVSFAKHILISIGLKNIIKTKNKWILITFNDRVSDLRQVVIYNNNLAFTRLISLESAGNDLAEFMRNDTIRTSEYIKRFDTDFVFDKLTIITILDESNKEKLKTLKVENAKVLNFTPYEIAKFLKINKSIAKDEKFLDLILNIFVLKNRSRVRFSNKKINIIFHLTILANAFKRLVFLSFLMCFFAIIIFAIVNINFNSKVSLLEEQLADSKNILQSKSKEEFGMESKEVDKIVDAGSVRDAINANSIDPMTSFEKFYRAQGDASLAYDLKWGLDRFDYQNVSERPSARITYNVSLLNPDGSASKLFAKYDELNLRLKNIFKNELVFITKMPTDINFDNKYYTHPIKIDIMERK